MKTVILAGGLGTRMSSKTENLPKPMIEIGNHPILWHIMQTYTYYGYNEFIICGGYKIEKIKRYFYEYHLMHHDVTFDLNGNYEAINPTHNNQKVSVIDTGQDDQTGSRLKQVKRFIDGRFFMTYGDGLSDINLQELLTYHTESRKICTMSAVKAQNKFGVLVFDDNDNIKEFKEKPISNNNWINAGYFVCEKEIFDYIPEGKDIQFEKEPLQKLIQDNQLNIYKHDGFWKCMDTKKDYEELNCMWLNTPKWRTYA